ncbi:MAG: hypothetical protein WBD41_31085, partial [Rhodococcus sp. (in: high G+C Gram-positive bacteria)]
HPGRPVAEAHSPAVAPQRRSARQAALGPRRARLQFPGAEVRPAVGSAESDVRGPDSARSAVAPADDFRRSAVAAFLGAPLAADAPMSAAAQQAR